MATNETRQNSCLTERTTCHTYLCTQHTAYSTHTHVSTHTYSTHTHWLEFGKRHFNGCIRKWPQMDRPDTQHSHIHTHTFFGIPSHRTHSHTHTHSLPSFFVALPLLSLPLLFCRPPSLTLSPSHLNFVFLPLTLYLPTFLALSFFLLSSKLQQPLWQRRKRTSRGLVSVWKYLKHNYSSTI